MGIAYWYAIFPLHAMVFVGMLRGIARRAVEDGGDAQRDARSRAVRKTSSNMGQVSVPTFTL